MNRRLAFRSVLVAILVGLALRYGNFSDLTSYLNAGLLLGMLAAQPFLFLSIAMMAMRFAVLASTPALPFLPAFKSMLLSIGLNALLPGRLSELLKVTYLRDNAGLSMTSGMAALFLERLIDVIVLGLLTLASISLLVLDSTAPTIALMVVAMVMLGALPVFEPRFAALARRLPWAPLRSAAGRFIAQLSGRVRDRLFYRAFVFGLAAWVLSWASVVIVVHLAGSIPIGLLGGLTVFVFTTFGSALPALPGGFGTYEAAAVIALKGFGYGFDEALALALAIHVSQLLGTLGVALLIVFTERIGLMTLLHQTVNFVRSPGK